MKNQKPSPYLILPNTSDECLTWGMSAECIALIYYADSKTLKKLYVQEVEIPTEELPIFSCGIIVYSDKEFDDETKRILKARIRSIAGDDILIWHHAGGARVEITMEWVYEEFVDAKFIEAGFSPSASIRPFSRGTTFKWQKEIDIVRDEFFKRRIEEAEPFLGFEDAIATLDEAWKKASNHFFFERLAPKLIEVMFPHYVHFRNSAVVEHRANDNGATNPLATPTASSAIGELHSFLLDTLQKKNGALREAFENYRIKLKATDLVGDKKLLAESFCELLALGVNKEVVPQKFAELFQSRFVALSNQYTNYLNETALFFEGDE